MYVRNFLNIVSPRGVLCGKQRIKRYAVAPPWFQPRDFTGDSRQEGQRRRDKEDQKGRRM